MDLSKAIGSGLKLKIIRFFHENQASIDSPRGVAAWVASDRPSVKKALEELVSLGLLVANRSTSTTGYSYTRDPKLIQAIARFLKKKSA